MSGVIFDIQEFSVNDGPGLRVTVFLKGCPLRCRWCHNPEGLNPKPQLNRVTGRMVGRSWEVDELVDYLYKFKDAYDLSDGGVTFSGGEATMQGEFLIEASKALQRHGIHVNLDTCGYCESHVFCEVLKSLDLVYYDLKCMVAETHQVWCGVSNDLILANARVLAESVVPYHIRVPLIPGVVDTPSNISEIKRFVTELPRQPESIDYLPYNKLAGGKYPAYGMQYEFKEVCWS